MIKCKHCNFISNTVSENANHTRWKHYVEDTSTKFLRKICCLECKSEISVQGYKSHLKTHDVKPKTGNCAACNADLFNKNKFCSSSCSAQYTNVRKDYSKIRTGPKVGSKQSRKREEKPKYTKIRQCTVCEKFHPRTGKTCSSHCKSKLLSMLVNERIDNGWNPQESRCRSRPSFLEKSFADWLESIQYVNYVPNKTFRCGDKLYFGDFFFPNQKILIELDGSQHKDSIEYDNTRDYLIFKFHGVRTIRITHREYMLKSKLELVKSAIEAY